MRRARAFAVAAILAAAAATGCGGGARAGETELTVTFTNRTGEPVDGLVLRFDKPLAGLAAVGARPFPKEALRLEPADTLHLSGAELAPGASVRYRFAATTPPPPRILDARWLVGGRYGGKLRPPEMR